TRELWKIRDDGTDLTQVTFTNTNGIRTTWSNLAYKNMGTASNGRFIPGTDLIVFSAHNGNGWYRLFVCNADGTDDWYRVSNEYSFLWSMSPTVNKLVWGHAGYWNYPTTLYSSDVNGSNKILVKSSNLYRLAPYILADGNTLIFRYSAAADWAGYPPVPATLEGNIYAINLDGSNERTILDDDYLNYYENYNPIDEEALLMSSNRSKDGNMHIYTLNVDGTGIVQLTKGPYNDETAIYSPTGQYIMYRRLPEDYVKDRTNLPYPYDLVIVKVWHWYRHHYPYWSHWCCHCYTRHHNKMCNRF
ncbi:MAG: TolB family protein, partial [Promethearchaeota archaeon]